MPDFAGRAETTRQISLDMNMMGRGGMGGGMMGGRGMMDDSMMENGGMGGGMMGRGMMGGGRDQPDPSGMLMSHPIFVCRKIGQRFPPVLLHPVQLLEAMTDFEGGPAAS